MGSRSGNAGRFGIALVSIVLGVVVVLGSARISKAAAAGWTVADFKGSYVGHWNGQCSGVPASGVLQIGADGEGNISINTNGDGLPGGIVPVTVNGFSGFVISEDAARIFRGYLSDRGKRVDFFLYGGACSGSGGVTIQ